MWGLGAGEKEGSFVWQRGLPPPWGQPPRRGSTWGIIALIQGAWGTARADQTAVCSESDSFAGGVLMLMSPGKAVPKPG